MITVREYLALRGRNPWEEWFENLDSPAQAQVTAMLPQSGQDDFSSTGMSALENATAGSDPAGKRGNCP